MSSQAASSRRWLFCLLVLLLAAGKLQAYGPQGFDTVIIDAGHGGYDHGGGPGQRIYESTYTLDTALRLQRALRSRGFKTVMTRTQDVFVTLRDRVAIGSSYRNAIFVSVHYNSGSRLDARGFETYYYRPDSFGLASRLHAAQLASMNTEDRHVRRDPFYVLRNPTTPAVLCEGGFLTNPDEANVIMSSSYRERWAQNIASALVEQRRNGDPSTLGYQPPVTTVRAGSSAAHSSGPRRGGRGSASRSGGRGRSGGNARHGKTSSSRGKTTGSSRGKGGSSSHGKSSDGVPGKSSKAGTKSGSKTGNHATTTKKKHH